MEKYLIRIEFRFNGHSSPYIWVKTRPQLINWIKGQKEEGYKSSCVFYLNGDVDIHLDWKGSQFAIGSAKKLPANMHIAQN